MRSYQAIEVLAYLIEKGNTGAKAKELKDSVGATYSILDKLYRMGFLEVGEFGIWGIRKKWYNLYSYRIPNDLISKIGSLDSDRSQRLGVAFMLLSDVPNPIKEGV